MQVPRRVLVFNPVCPGHTPQKIVWGGGALWTWGLESRTPRILSTQTRTPREELLGLGAEIGVFRADGHPLLGAERANRLRLVDDT
jgi:hypothetical protein